MTNEERDACLKRIDVATNTTVDALTAIHGTLKEIRFLSAVKATVLLAAAFVVGVLLVRGVL